MTNIDDKTGIQEVKDNPYSPISFRHLMKMTDSRGILEHANHTTPRFSHGYCSDDNARLLVLASRANGTSTGSEALAHTALRFLLDAQSLDGTIHNRMSFARVWTDTPSTDDCWGRAIWGFGTAAGQSTDEHLRTRGLQAFERSAQQQSPWLRANCFAALGATEVLRVDPNNQIARQVLQRTSSSIPDFVAPVQQSIACAVARPWMWPERKLTYANAVIPEILIASGQHLNNDHDLQRGLHLLEWLIATETHDEHLSVTPTTGRRFGDPVPGFDQQPIEVAAIADAIWRAASATKNPNWLKDYALCVNWFHGANDVGVPMIDYESHGGFDGLTKDGVNKNQGAESTLAMLTTLQERQIP